MLRRKETSLAPREATPRSLFEEFDRIFEQFRNGMEDVFWTPMLGPLALWGPAGVRQVVADLQDKGNEFVLTTELPGVSKENLDLNVTEDGVEIRAQTGRDEERKDDGYYHRERSYASWYRRLPFPAEIVPEKAEAELKDGVLTFRVPKEPTPEKKARKVQVK